MREGGSGWTGVCWRVISEGCGWSRAGWLGGADAPKVGGQCGPEREPKASAREGNERRVNRAGGGPVLALSIFSPGGFFGTIGLRTFPYSTLRSAGDWFSGLFLKNFIISDVATFRCRYRSWRAIRAVRPFVFPARNGIWRHRCEWCKKIWKSGISPYLCDVGRATRSAGAVLFFLRFIPPFPRLRCVPGRLSKPLGLTAGLFA
jgi:hypothetical protein